MAMLNQGSKLKNSIIFFIGFIVISCIRQSDLSKDFKKKSLDIIGKEEYEKIYKQFLDSTLQWKRYKIFGSFDSTYSSYKLDSLLCFNKARNKLVAANLDRSLNRDAVADGLDFFYGLKISNQWYFYRGAYIVLPRNMYQKDIHTPLSFAKLHEIALKEIYSGYLTKNGEINEAWFTYHFARNGQPQEEINKTIISQNKGMWLGNYNPYKKEDISFKYNKETKQATVSFELQTPDSFYLEPMGYKILYTYKKLGSIGNTCGSAFCDINWKKNKVAERKISYLPDGIDVDIYIEELFYINNQCKRLGPFTFNTSNSEKDKKNILP